MSKSANLHNNIISSPVEAIFIYSCSVRKMFIGEQLNYEFGLIEQIAPTAGFFTYGEFYHSGVKNQLLNITTTTLSLSESDKILKEFAKNIGNQRNNIFRISSDEFAILCEHNLDTQARNSIIEMIVDLQSIEYTVLQDNMSLYLSCGVAYGRKDEIYKQAHIALKESKISKQEIVFYNDNEDLTKQIEDNIKIISNIKQGIKEDRFVPYFQGIMDNKTKKITKYECLIRLKERRGNVISPFFFLEHAKKAKLYTKLTKIMISKSFAIAEFVEDEEVFETLCDLGVDFSQGYLFSKPSEELVK